MRYSTLFLAAALALGALSACGDDDGAGPGPSGTTATSTTETIGEAGGEAHIAGASVEVPAGALSGDKDIGVKKLSSSAASKYVGLLEHGYSALSEVYVLTPHGTQFEKPATIKLSYEGSGAHLSVQRLDDEDDQSWSEVDGATFEDGEATFETTHFSLVVVTSEAGEGDAGAKDDGQAGSTAPAEKDAGGESPQADAGPATPDGDFELTLPEPELEIAQGGMARYNVVAKRAAGFEAPIEVSVEDLPDGVTGGTAEIVGADDGTLIELTVAQDAKAGSYEISVVGTSGSTTRRAKGTLVITGPKANFTFTVLPYALTLSAGGSADTTVTITPVNGFEGTMNLSLEFAPDGLTIDPESFEVSGSEPTAQVVTFSADASTAPGMTNVNLNMMSPEAENSGGIGIGITIE